MKIRVLIGIASLVALAVLAITVNPFFWAMFFGGCVPWAQAAWERRRRAFR
jgi:hypothetical protein